MRVAILGPVPLDLTRLGGVEVAIVYLLDSLPAAGVDDVHVLCCLTGLKKEQTATVRGATVHYLPRYNHGRMTWHLRETRHMQAILRAIQPDIVDAHGTRLYGGAALGSGFPNVITVHGIVASEVALYRSWGMKLRGWVDVLYERWCLAQAKDLIAISPYAEEAFRPYTKARFHLVENPVDLAFFRLERRPQPGRILFAGPVSQRKGLMYLFQALARVKSAGLPFELRIAGGTAAEPAYYRSLVELAEASGLSASIHFLGHLDQASLLDEYARCSMLTLPSLQETAPMAVQQAMAAGVPVVATRAGGVPYQVQDGVTGLLVDAANSEALAGALLQALGDPQLRDKMGAAAQAQATERFHPHAIALKTKAVYDDILAGKGKA